MRYVGRFFYFQNIEKSLDKIDHQSKKPKKSHNTTGQGW